MKFSKITTLILTLAFLAPTPVLGRGSQAVPVSQSETSQAKAKVGVAVMVTTVAASQNSVVPVLRSSWFGPCVTRGNSSLLQGSVGLNLFSGAANCFSLKVVTINSDNQTLVVKSQPAYVPNVVVKTFPASIQNGSEVSSFPQARPAVPVPLALVFVAVAVYEIKRLTSSSDNRSAVTKVFIPLSLEQLQVYRC